MPARMAIIAMTTSNSIRVNPLRSAFRCCPQRNQTRVALVIIPGQTKESRRSSHPQVISYIYTFPRDSCQRFLTTTFEPARACSPQYLRVDVGFMLGPIHPRLEKWPFLIADAFLLGCAAFIYSQSDLPISGSSLALAAGCVIW